MTKINLLLTNRIEFIVLIIKLFFFISFGRQKKKKLFHRTEHKTNEQENIKTDSIHVQ